MRECVWVQISQYWIVALIKTSLVGLSRDSLRSLEQNAHIQIYKTTKQEQTWARDLWSTNAKLVSKWRLRPQLMQESQCLCSKWCRFNQHVIVCWCRALTCSYVLHFYSGEMFPWGTAGMPVGPPNVLLIVCESVSCHIHWILLSASSTTDPLVLTSSSSCRSVWQNATFGGKKKGTEALQGCLHKFQTAWTDDRVLDKFQSGK